MQLFCAKTAFLKIQHFQVYVSTVTTQKNYSFALYRNKKFSGLWYLLFWRYWHVAIPVITLIPIPTVSQQYLWPLCNTLFSGPLL